MELRANYGNLSLSNKIGSGAFGNVYLGKYNYDDGNIIDVAVKIICNPKNPDNIRREIGVLTEISNNNLCISDVIRLYDTFVLNDCIYLVTEYYQGDELSKLLPDQPTWLQIANFLTNAVKCIHKNNIVHRDIKLENILWNSDKGLRLIDFGFACSLDNTNSLLKCVKRSVGTPYYLSPELIRIEETDYDPNIFISSDIWAIGVVLYKLAYGYYPFRGQDIYDLLDAIEFTEPIFPEENQSDIYLKNIIQPFFNKNLLERISFFNNLDLSNYAQSQS
jgi:serine/threonine protein kinase